LQSKQVWLPSNLLSDCFPHDNDPGDKTQQLAVVAAGLPLACHLLHFAINK
jgi:hypothetical protein